MADALPQQSLPTRPETGARATDGCSPGHHTDGFNRTPHEHTPHTPTTHTPVTRRQQVEGVVFQPPRGDVAFAVVSGSEQTLKVEVKVRRNRRNGRDCCSRSSRAPDKR